MGSKNKPIYRQRGIEIAKQCSWHNSKLRNTSFHQTFKSKSGLQQGCRILWRNLLFLWYIVWIGVLLAQKVNTRRE